MNIVDTITALMWVLILGVLIGDRINTPWNRDAE